MKNKVLVLGVDGLDPRLTKKYMNKGVMPNFEKFVKRGAAREDLVMLGAMPTITPPMWTTLATGAYCETHGVTDFWNPHPENLIPWFIPLTLQTARQNHCGTYLPKPAEKPWYFTGRALLGLQPATAQISTL